MNFYVYKIGDSVDEICFHHYGFTNGSVEAVFEKNPGLATIEATGIIKNKEAGITIILPELKNPTEPEDTVRLFD